MHSNLGHSIYAPIGLLYAHVLQCDYVSLAIK